MGKIQGVKEIKKRLGVSLLVAKEMYENSEVSPVLVVSEQSTAGKGFSKNFVAHDNNHDWSMHEEGIPRLRCSLPHTQIVPTKDDQIIIPS